MTPADQYVLQQASSRAGHLVASGRFHAQDREDLQQNIVLDYLRRDPKYDAARGDRRGFVRGITRNCAVVLLTRKNRTAQRELLASDLFAAQTAESEIELIGALHRGPFTECEHSLHLRIDVRRVLDAMPLKLKVIAFLLSEMPVVAVCDQIGKSRSHVYQLKRQLRDAFYRAGFRPSRTGNRRKDKGGSNKSFLAHQSAPIAGVRR